MNCSDCRKPMSLYTVTGVPTHCCHSCGKTVALPMAGPTTQHSSTSRKQTSTPTPREPSEGEVSFAEAWRDLHPSLPFVTEYKFCSTREWEIDFFWEQALVAVEYEGGGPLGHGRNNRYNSDVAKYNAMAECEILLFRCTKPMLYEEKIERFCRQVAETIRKRMK